MSDITMVPASASFFGVSTDELFDFNLLEIEKKVEFICAKAYEYRESDPVQSEDILREGLKKYPGNDISLSWNYRLSYWKRMKWKKPPESN